MTYRLGNIIRMVVRVVEAITARVKSNSSMLTVTWLQVWRWRRNREKIEKKVSWYCS